MKKSIKCKEKGC